MGKQVDVLAPGRGKGPREDGRLLTAVVNKIERAAGILSKCHGNRGIAGRDHRCEGVIDINKVVRARQCCQGVVPGQKIRRDAANTGYIV